MIHDYTLQIHEIQRNLETQSLVTKENWQDSVGKRFYEKYVDKYEEVITLYINGGMGIVGMGLDELLRFFDQKQTEMSQLSGTDIQINSILISTGHSVYRKRENWHEAFDGTQPGNLNAQEVKKIMTKRELNR